MADEQAKINIDTGIDTSGFEKGYSELEKTLIKAESEIIKIAAQQTKDIEDEAQKQVKSINEAENEKIADIKRGLEAVKETENAKIAEIQKSIQEQIAAEKEKPGLDPAAMQTQIQAIREAENAKIAEIRKGLQEQIAAENEKTKKIKAAAKQEEADVKKSMNNKLKVVQEVAKKQLKAIQDAYKKSGDSVKEFVKGAIGELAGMDQALAAVANGPVAIGKLVVDMSKKAVAALNEMAASWREQEQVEVALQNAAKNNPYLNDRAVKQLKNFANEMQRMTGMDSVQIMQTETRLASLGRNQDQMQRIIKTAADMAASGVMSYDEAVNELNNSLNGTVRTSARLYPELKNLSAEALASGAAIDVIAGKVAGSAAEAMKTGAGSVTAYENAVGSLKKIIGQGWEEATAPARRWITGIIDNFNKAAETKQKISDILTDKTINIDIAFGELSDQELKKMGDMVGLYGDLLGLQIKESMRMEGISALEATERQIRQIAENEDMSAEMVRRSILEYKNLEAETKSYLELLGERTRAEYELAKFQEIADKTREAKLKADSVLATNTFADIFILLRQAEVAEKEHNAQAVRNYRLRAEELLGILENEGKLTEERTEQAASAKQFREENQAALDAEIEKILRRANLEGKNRNDLEVQKQILDAEVQAYENLLSAAKGYIDGTDEIERNRFANLKQQWAAFDERAGVEKWTDEQRSARLTELANKQRELQGITERMLKDAQNEAARQSELDAEKEQAEKIAEMKKAAMEESRAWEIKKRKEAVEEIADFELNAEKARLESIAAEKIKQLEDGKEDQLNFLEELKQAELAKYREGHPARIAIEEEYQQKKKELEENTAAAIEQININKDAKIREIEEGRAEYLKQLYADLLKEQLDGIQEIINASQQLAGSITSIWNNIVDAQTEEKLKANREMVQSDEERAKKEKEIMMKAAHEKYKAELFAWSLNVTVAAAQAAMAVLKALVEGGPVMAGIAGVLAAAQVAAIATAMPRPPSFHTGGVVQGRGEVSATLLGGEKVTTNKQFNNIMDAFANVANMEKGGGGASMIQPQVQINNTVSDQAQASTRFDSETLIIDITNKALSQGKMDSGLANQKQNAGGADLSW